MSKVTQEILARIEKALKESDDEFITEIREDYGEDLNEILQGINYEDDLSVLPDYVPGLTLVDEGNQGDGTEAYMVYKDEATGVHVGFTGWYASHEGTDYDDFDMVEMEPFTVQHWKKKTK